MIPWIGRKLHALPILLTRWWNRHGMRPTNMRPRWKWKHTFNTLLTHFPKGLRHISSDYLFCALFECAQVPLSEHFVKKKWQNAICNCPIVRSSGGGFIWSPLAIWCIFIDFGHLHSTKQYSLYNPIDCRAKSSVHSFASFGKHWVSEPII